MLVECTCELMNARCDTVALNTALLDVYRWTERCLLNFVAETTCCLILACVIRRMWTAVWQRVFYSLACIAFIYMYIEFSVQMMGIFIYYCVWGRMRYLWQRECYSLNARCSLASRWSFPILLWRHIFGTPQTELSFGLVNVYLFIFSHRNSRLIYKLLEMWILENFVIPTRICLRSS